jgi:hypothetical protein
VISVVESTYESRFDPNFAGQVLLEIAHEQSWAHFDFGTITLHSLFHRTMAKS